MIEQSLRVLVAWLRDGSGRATALFEEVEANHRASEPRLNAYITWSPELAEAQAKAADALMAAGADLGPLQGVPVSVKDAYGLAGLPIYAGTRRELPPYFRQEGPIIRALKRQVAVLTGKTHTPEFAFGGIGRNSHWGTPRNPWDAQLHRVPGGSSSGAAVSLSQGTAILALGSDTAGSVRVPASWTGNVGFKTTKGRWPADGIVPQSRLYDSPGLLARSVEDLMLAIPAVERRIESPAHDVWTEPVAPALSDVRIGVPEQFFWSDCAPGIAERAKEALDALVRAGARLVPVKVPEAAEAWSIFQQGGIIATELFTFVSQVLPDRLDELDPMVGPRVLAAKEVPATVFLTRQWRLEQLAAAAQGWFTAVDVVASPTVAIPPPSLEDVTPYDDYLARNFACLRNTSVVNYLRLCAVSMPVGLDALGLPVGLQLIAAGDRDRHLLSIACALERVLGNSLARLGKPPLLSF